MEVCVEKSLLQIDSTRLLLLLYRLSRGKDYRICLYSIWII